MCHPQKPTFTQTLLLYHPSSFTEIAFILVSGVKAKSMEVVNYISPTKAHTQDNLILEKLKVKEDYFIQMGIFILGNGKTTRLTESADTYQEVEQFSKGNGKTMKETVTVEKHGQMGQFFKENIETTKKMVKGSFDGQMEMSMWGSSKITKKMEKER